MEEGQPTLKSLNLEGLVDLHQRLDLVGPEFTDSPTALMSPDGDALGQLPAFNRRAPRPDPRRESGVLLAGFTKATAGEGLLDDDEIAVGDEDILISLPKAAKSHGASGGHSTLWLEPHTDELLGGDLPEPQFSGAAAGGLTAIAESPEREPSGLAAEPSGLASPGRPAGTPSAVVSPPRTAATALGPAAVTSPSRTAQEPAALVSPTRQAGAATAAASPAADQQGAATRASPVCSPVLALLTEPSAGAVGAASRTPVASPPANDGTASAAAAVTSPGGLVPQPQACSSPRTSTKEEKKAPNSAERPISGMRVRDSTCLAAGLSKLCLEKGFSDLDFENDFLMTDSNKVKEMALLFKMEVDAQVASPTATAAGGSQRTSELGGAAAGSTAESSVRARVNQLQSAPRPATAPTTAPRAGRPPAGPSSRPSTAAAPGSGVAGAAGSRQPASRLRAPSAASRYSNQPATESRPGSSASGRAPLSSRSSTSSIGGVGTRAVTPAGGRPPVAPANRALPAWGSRAAAAAGPKPAASGIRPPGPAGTSRVGSQAASGAAGTPTRTAAARPSSTPSPGARSTGSRAASPTQSPSLANRPSWGARSPQPAAAARPSTSPAAPSPASRASPRQPAGSTCTAAGRPAQPTRSRLAQPGTAQAAGQPRRTATQPAAGGPTGAEGGDQSHRSAAAQRAVTGSRLAGAGRQRAPAAVSSDTPSPSAAAEASRPTTSNASAPKLPKLQLNPPPANNDNITPNTARLRFLEENPELAFGGGTKISMSNSPTAQQQPHRKTTVDKHWEAWGDDA